jgi:hypothetical protein
MSVSSHRKEDKPVLAHLLPVKAGAGSEQPGIRLGEHEKEGRHNFPQSTGTDAGHISHEETPAAQHGKEVGSEHGAKLGGAAVGTWETVKQKASEIMGTSKEGRCGGTSEENEEGWTGNTAASIRRRAEPLVGEAETAAKRAKEAVEDIAGRTQESIHQGMVQAQGFFRRRNFKREDMKKLAKIGLMMLVGLWLISSLLAHLMPSTDRYASSHSYGMEGFSPSGAADWASEKYNSMLDYMHLREPLVRSSHTGRSWFGKDDASEAAWHMKDRAAEQASHAYLDALHKAEQAKAIAEQRAREATSFLRSLGYSYSPQARPSGIFGWIGNRWDDLKSIVWRKSGLWGEEARHQTKLAMENARHRTAEAGYAGTGSDLSFGEKVKNVMERLNPMA